MKVGVDLDGVCYDFVQSVRHFLVTHKGFDPKRCGSYLRWEFYEDWGMTLKEFLDACHEGADLGVIFGHGNAYPGTRKALQRLIDGGHTLHVVTDRSFGKPGSSEATTMRWIREELPRVHSVTFTSDKTVANVDVMVDDKIQNYDDLDGIGVEVYLLDRPWNQDPGDSRRRVDDLDHYADLVGKEPAFV